ncbi:hypothetical protein C8034_v008549 [Colletotrichum sidae]|uniref:Uncharacterized protein n=1 Tax=Colletotrichum sidae TaxID=1347389 RepID=A0A4R8TQL8_9PEZI|nr:hypothetical protein C8034_v008549 [Colletotrichum sidae]
MKASSEVKAASPWRPPEHGTPDSNSSNAREAQRGARSFRFHCFYFTSRTEYGGICHGANYSV